MTVMRRQTRRRWLLVAAGVAVLLALPTVVRAVPSGPVRIDPDTLARRIAASAGQPYSGYAVSSGSAGLPTLPQLGDVISLFDGDTSLRIWYGSPTRWRVDQVSTAGEFDVYRSTTGETTWDSGRQQLTTISKGSPPVLTSDGGYVFVTPTPQPFHAPRGADLVPADLARRLLSAGTTGTTRTTLPARRIAGVDAAGLRLTSTDPSTTVSRVDIWAEPRTGLPVQVDVYARGVKAPALSTRLLDLSLTAPGTATTTPPDAPPGVNRVDTSGLDLADVLRSVSFGRLPDTLAGLPRHPISGVDLPGVGVYGTGFRQLVAVVVPPRTGLRALRAARDAGGTEYQLPDGHGVSVSTPLLGMLIVDSDTHHRVYMVVGLVDPSVLATATAELVAYDDGGDP